MKKIIIQNSTGFNGVDIIGANGNAISDASSSVSRFYDNGADTTSSLSDNIYSENHNIANKIVPTNNGKTPIIGFDKNSSLKHKLPIGKMTQVPPPINQRSSIFQYIFI